MAARARAGLAALPPEIREEYLRTLEQLITATQVRHPVVGDLARRVRFRSFDEPLLAAARARGQQEVRAELDRLAATTDPAVRAAIIDDIVAAAEPILSVFGEPHHAAMLEVMTRRYYRIRHLTDVTVVDRGGRPLLSATYRARRARPHRARDHRAHRARRRRSRASRPRCRPTCAGSSRSCRPTAPCCSTSTSPRARRPTTTRSAPRRRSASRWARCPHRWTGWPSRSGGPARTSGRAGSPSTPPGTPAGLTPRGEPQPVEDRTLRGLHPMVAERLGLWRLTNFALTRLPSPIDVHLFRAVGRNVPDDRRLVVLSDVRDLTVVRDAARPGARPAPARARPRRLPGRPARGPRRPIRADARSDWNRVLLYVWPVVDLPLDELDSVVSRLAPRTEGLGLEQILVQFRLAPQLVEGGPAEPTELLLRLSRPPGAGLTVRVTEAAERGRCASSTPTRRR